MTDISGIAVNQALVRQEATASFIKNAADRDQQFVNAIAEAVESTGQQQLNDGGRGSNVNILV